MEIKIKNWQKREIRYSFIGYCQEALTLTFGEIAKFIDGFNEGKACPVNIEPLISGYGQKSEETDCSYWVEALYTIICNKPDLFPNLGRFKTLCTNQKFIENITSSKEKLKQSARKATQLGLSENPSDYPKRTALQGGLSVTEQPKKPKLFSQIQDGNDQPTTATLKISEESKKVFKDIELIKITPKNYKEGQQLSSSELAEQIEKNGFTKEILENNNITIKRKNVEHFEPLGNFLLKNINKNLVGYNKGYSKEV